MGKNTAIEWCDATFNGWWGCAEVSTEDAGGGGCDNCYAREFAHRLGMELWGTNAPRRTFGDKHWDAPLQWARTLTRKLGRRPRVFCSSMADIFDNNSPAGARDRLWALIRATPELDWLLLTKRIGNARSMLPGDWCDAAGYANVWLGATVVNQKEVDRDVSKLLEIPARIRFLSCEPLLGAIDLTGEYLADCCGGGYPFPTLAREHRTTRLEMLDWVISGGESGRKARPSHPDWHRALRDQCAAVRVPFLFKQIGEWTWHDEPVRPKADAAQRIIFSDGSTCAPSELHDLIDAQRRGARIVRRIGKKAAGRDLDGRTHNEFPIAA